MPQQTQQNKKPWFTVGAVLSLGVAIFFLTVGDGVSTTAGGPVGFILTYAHAAVWLLMAVAFAIAAARGEWHQWSGRIAAAALAVYAVFLGTLLFSG